jgi:hypothetical protein
VEFDGGAQQSVGYDPHIWHSQLRGPRYQDLDLWRTENSDRFVLLTVEQRDQTFCHLRRVGYDPCFGYGSRFASSFAWGYIDNLGGCLLLMAKIQA